VDASSWRAQVFTALNIIDAMVEMNPSAPKCRDIIYRLCGESLMSPRELTTVSQPDLDFSNMNAFSFSTPDSHGSGVAPWMTEIDTAIDGYDAYLGRLTNTASAGMGGQHNDSDFSYSSANAGNGLLPGWDEMGTGMQDWDLGMMLS
jgi:hypothetical protein